jgi:hypothetical protein
MFDWLTLLSVAVIVACFVAIIVFAERKARDIEQSLNELVSIMAEKNHLANANERLAETVGDLVEKNTNLYKMLTVKREGVQSEAPRLVGDKFPDVGKE